MQVEQFRLSNAQCKLSNSGLAMHNAQRATSNASWAISNAGFAPARRCSLTQTAKPSRSSWVCLTCFPASGLGSSTRAAHHLVRWHERRSATSCVPKKNGFKSLGSLPYHLTAKRNPSAFWRDSSAFQPAKWAANCWTDVLWYGRASGVLRSTGSI